MPSEPEPLTEDVVRLTLELLQRRVFKESQDRHGAGPGPGFFPAPGSPQGALPFEAVRARASADPAMGTGPAAEAEQGPASEQIGQAYNPVIPTLGEAELQPPPVRYGSARATRPYLQQPQQQQQTSPNVLRRTAAPSSPAAVEQLRSVALEL